MCDFINVNIVRVIFQAIVVSVIVSGCSTSENWKWEAIEAIGTPTARHEAGLVAYQDQLILIGGRRINPTDFFDTKTSEWTAKSPTPIEVHHFQPVVVDEAIYLVGAMTGGWPEEKPLDRVLIYYPAEDRFEFSHEIPESRRRGGAGTVYHNGKIYLVGGIVNGHMNGYKPWFDEYDPVTGEWKVLPDAPDARDHFQAAVSNGQLFAFAGRRSSHGTGEDLDLTTSHGNVYDFQSRQWQPVTNLLKIPTERAGNAAFAWKDEIVIGGGESATQEASHAEVEAYNTVSQTWRKWPNLLQGRHGSGFAVIGDFVYIVSGSGNRGGGPELTTIERLKLPTSSGETAGKDPDVAGQPVYQQYHTVEIDFEGPHTSETAADNPFLNYLLTVTFKHPDTTLQIRGFYAADGSAGQSGADKGKVWKVRFTPELQGEWLYSATLLNADSIALRQEAAGARSIDLQTPEGAFSVIASDKEGPDFRAYGRLEAHRSFFKFRNTDKYWMKGGANSPENLLGYVDFDGTYRMQSQNREGEANVDNTLHRFEAHLQDWQPGDPTWRNGKGKSLIGAINYLASKGMNAVYFLTMNIGGDGKDVWPYQNPEDPTRFDVSKLDQWEMVFQHMQRNGIMLHVVLQETENETMLDRGDTGPLRQLYFNEMIARFGHHLALVWNLGEENGPASWSPVGQNDRQRKDMAKFLKQADPYNHPVLLHTHAYDPLRQELLDSIVGFPYLDGLSLQQDKRVEVPRVIKALKDFSAAQGKKWLITMDEIGMWHTGALTDSLDPGHPTLIKYALWGALLSGGAGVEWYFGAQYPHNDLSSEDWRQRDRLWELTDHAVRFFEKYLPYWEMSPAHELIGQKGAWCLQKEGVIYAAYLAGSRSQTLNLEQAEGTYEVHWYDPLLGGALQVGSEKVITGGGVRRLGLPPEKSKKQDWICLIRRKGEG